MKAQERNIALALRSPSIAIKKTIRPTMKSYVSHDNIYDLATWRMYHRIIEYREKKSSLSDSYYTDSSSSSSISNNQLDEEQITEHYESVSNSTGQIVVSTQSNEVVSTGYEEDVFDLDL